MQIETIVYREFETPIGKMVGGASSHGCLLLEFEDRGGFDRINKRIHKRYGVSLSPGNNEHVDQLEAELHKYFEGQLKNFTVKISQKGTHFQGMVWEELLRIPYGETCSYGDIANRIGKPGAMRAVGRANGDNYVAIVIPCHRVIQSDGGLGGYGGGVWRKEYLLNLERG